MVGFWVGESTTARVAGDLLAVFLVMVGPIWDYFEGQALRAAPSHALRMRYYVRTFVWLWVAAGVACWSCGISSLTTVGGLGIHAGWLERRAWGWRTLAVALAVIVAVQLVLPVIQVLIKYRDREFLELAQLKPLRFFLPAVPVERRWFAALCVTAGVCEELLFRGFLLRYLHRAPLHLGLGWAILLAAVVFGTHHFYQGVKGFFSTTLGGLIFTGILLLTGSLSAGMVYHAAADMSLLVYWRPKPE
jgi:uncharacterized protein